MFFHISLERDILVHPRFFGPNLMNTIRQILLSEVEGHCMGRFGFIVAVTGIDSVRGGYVQSGRGLVLYPVKYKAIVFRPFKNEVVDAVITQVTKVGIFCKIGPLTCYISNRSIPADMEFDPNSNPPRYRKKDEDLHLQLEDEIRLKIIGYRVSSQDFFAVGSLLDDFLGRIN
ncbi:hypothetical protein GJ496_004525 [Pomphorhynchus laevis]|nr:hypothetical protein GJ496_004525 [Pomphorhynchus laevis]